MAERIHVWYIYLHYLHYFGDNIFDLLRGRFLHENLQLNISAAGLAIYKTPFERKGAALTMRFVLQTRESCLIKFKQKLMGQRFATQQVCCLSLFLDWPN